MQDARPLVSIIIPCYKQAHFLGDAIECALSQTYGHVEVVVVDDGSPDDPAAVVARYPQVRFVQQANRGRSAARNAGLRASHGEYIVFLDSDDLLLPHALETGMQAFAGRPAYAFVHGTVDRRSLDGTLLKSPTPIVGETDYYLELLKRNCIRGIHSAVIRRTALEAVGGFDERRPQANDWDLFLRLARQFPVYGHGRLVGTYRRHDRNVNSKANADAMLRSSLAVLREQREYALGNARYAEAYRSGLREVRTFWGELLVERARNHARAGRWGPALRDGVLVLRYYPRGFMAHATRKLRAVSGVRRPAA